MLLTYFLCMAHTNTYTCTHLQLSGKEKTGYIGLHPTHNSVALLLKRMATAVHKPGYCASSYSCLFLLAERSVTTHLFIILKRVSALVNMYISKWSATQRNVRATHNDGLGRGKACAETELIYGKDYQPNYNSARFTSFW